MTPIRTVYYYRAAFFTAAFFAFLLSPPLFLAFKLGSALSVFEGYFFDPVSRLFEEWALQAMKEMNGAEAIEREAIEKAQFKNLQRLRKQYDKLVDMASKELIQDDTFQEKSKTLLGQIKNAENDVTGTNDRASNWRDAMYKTIDVIAHGRERFNSGDFTAKQDVLLALGTYPTLYDGLIELTPFEWLIPIEQGLSELNEAIKKVQPQDLQIGNLELEPIRLQWLAIGDDLRALLVQKESLH